jgi:hypothetical protein
MTGSGAKERLWLRPAGLLALGLGLAMGQPFVLVAVPFALLILLKPGTGAGALLLGAVALALVFAGEPGGGFWYLERGWAILVGGWFAALSLAWPHRPFLVRGLLALGGAVVWAGAILLAVGGWGAMEWLVEERVQASAAATLELLRTIAGSGTVSGFGQTVQATARVQAILFPALLALSTLATLGVAWWTFEKVTVGSGRGLSPLRDFRFADPLIWVLIIGVGLVLAAGWTGGWGRVGANLMAFMGGLYALRGVAVLLFVTGGLSLLSGALVAVGLVLAAPVLLTAAMAVGVGDSWLDLRARRQEAGGDGRE